MDIDPTEEEMGAGDITLVGGHRALTPVCKPGSLGL